MGVPSDLLTLLNERYAALKYLLEIGTTPPIRICTGLDDIEYDSNTYTARGWKPGQVVGGEISTAGFSATIEDIDATLELRAYTEGLTGLTMTLTILGHDGDGVWKTAWQPITCPIYSVDGGHHFVNLAARGVIGMRSRSGLKKVDALCRHFYKGARCQYAGSEATCPKTFDACENRSGGDNTANFGGCRYGPEAGTIIPLGPSGATIPETPEWQNYWGWGDDGEEWGGHGGELMPSPPPPSTDGMSEPPSPGHGGTQAPEPGSPEAS